MHLKCILCMILIVIKFLCVHFKFSYSLNVLKSDDIDVSHLV